MSRRQKEMKRIELLRLSREVMDRMLGRPNPTTATSLYDDREVAETARLNMKIAHPGLYTEVRRYRGNAWGFEIVS